ncbi:Mariner transposase, partial [Caligus rogercresseyi]
TMNGEYYTSLLDRFNEDLKKKRPYLAKKSSFHQEMQESNMCVSMAKFYELRYELLPHPPYSPDLAPSDYSCFPNLKKWLAEKRFILTMNSSHKQIHILRDLEKSYFLEGIKTWKKTLDEVV